MKSFYLLAFSFLLPLALLAQDPVISRSEGSITFKVSETDVLQKPLFQVPSVEAIQFQLKKQCEGFPEFSETDSLIPIDFNGFVAAFHLGFALHYPVIVTPDIIWLVLCQGLAIHINQKADSLRHNLVDFEGKKEVEILRPDFIKGENNPWPEAFSALSLETRRQLKDSLYKIMTPSFSTTGPNEKAAVDISFLESVSNYFNYSVETYCGIPEIQLKGTSDDWKKIRTNIECFRNFGMNEWVDALEPILDEFINASEGKINLLFWRSFYKYLNESGGPYINGYITQFFPYLLHDSTYVKNPLISQPLQKYFGLTTSCIPSGLGKISILLKTPENQNGYPMVCYAGYLGIEQDPMTYGLKPAILWAVCDSNADVFSLPDRQPDFRSNYAVFDKPKNRPLFVQSISLNESNHTGYHFQKAMLLRKPDGKEHSDSALLVEYFTRNLSQHTNSLTVNLKLEISWTGDIGSIITCNCSIPEFREEIFNLVKNIKPVAPAYLDGVPFNSELSFDLIIP